MMSLEQFVETSRPCRVAALGIGNEMSGDDGVGVHVARRLATSLGCRDDVLVIEAGTAPENFTGPIRRFRPGLVLLIDAASFDQPAGSIRLIHWQESDGFSGSTHTLPPSVFAKFLAAELGCRLALLGIQPAGLDFGEPLSAPVEAAAGRLVSVLGDWLTAASEDTPA